MTPQPLREKRLVLGVDYGRLVTPSAIVAAEHHDPETKWDSYSWSWQPTRPGPDYLIRLAERLPLHTSYHEVARTVWTLAEKHGAAEIRLDGTGVGDAICEIMQQARPLNCRAKLRPIKLTAGHQATDSTIPRPELFQRTALAFESGRVKVARGTRGWRDLVAELQSIGVQGERLGPSDDLAIALGLALWVFAPPKQAGERPGRLL